MPIAALFILLAGGTTVAILYPQLRIAALTVLVVFGAATGAYFTIGGGMVARQAASIAPEELTLSGVTLTDENGYTVLAGRVANGSESHALRDFDIEIQFFDCPEPESALPDCTIIADEMALTRVAVPVGQTRDFRTIFRLQSLSQVQGTLRWEWKITDASTSDI